MDQQKFDALTVLLTTGNSVSVNDVARLDDVRRRLISEVHDPLAPPGTLRPIQAEVTYESFGETVTAQGLAAILVEDSEGNRTPYYLGSGSRRGEFQLFSQEELVERIQQNPSLGGQPVWLTDEPLSFEEFQRLQEHGVNINGMGADGLFESVPEVQVDVPEIFAPPVIEDAPPVVNSTPDLEVAGGSLSGLVRPDGDFIATTEGRMPPAMTVESLREADVPDSAPEVALTQEAPEANEPAEVNIVPYAGEDIRAWLAEHHNVVLPEAGAPSQQIETALVRNIDNLFEQIAAGAVDPAAREAIVAEISRFDDPRFGEHSYAAFVNEFFENGLGGGDAALEAVRSEFTHLQVERMGTVYAIEAEAAPVQQPSPAPLDPRMQ